MKKNKDIIIICSIIALFILTIDIILSLLVEMYFICALLALIFIAGSIALIIFTSRKPKKKTSKKSIINNIEHTIMLKLEDLDSIKITPIRSKMEVELKNDKSIKEDLKIQRQNNITKERLEEELSKTIFISNLKEKMELFELEQEKLRKKEEEKELKELNKLIKERKN